MLPSVSFRFLQIFSIFALTVAPLAVHAGDPPLQEDFNAKVFKVSNEAVRKQLDNVLGENDGRCDDMMVLVVNTVYQCLRDKAKCAPATTANGFLVVSCPEDNQACFEVTASIAAGDFWTVKGACKELNAKVNRPGCGNLIMEFGEDCDLGDNNGVANSTCSDQCKVAGGTAQGGGALCGNQVVDPGEECDAGTGNGKRDTDCDVQCKKFSAIGAAPAANGQPQAGNGASGGCTVQRIGTTDIPLYHLLILGVGTALLLRKPVRVKS